MDVEIEKGNRSDDGLYSEMDDEVSEYLLRRFRERKVTKCVVFKFFRNLHTLDQTAFLNDIIKEYLILNPNGASRRRRKKHHHRKYSSD
jgi:hypothetical protein